MRLQNLDLIRYGKFTDRSLELARSSDHDFHLILGPNEAGKSTLRGAILDLLFGFPPRTPLDFVHAKSELRLGAVLQHDDQTLAFMRLKGNKNTLRAPDETILPDTALQAFLGGASRAFFDKMFGLDHPRLVQGGNSILNAQDDVGQILFQSAAGLSSLGRVRDALAQEADSLWAPTRSGKRSYYAARADMEAAVEILKSATVHTRKWADAQERVRTLEKQLLTQRDLLISQQTRRDRLERIRRVNPVIQELNDSIAQLAELGDVVSLPADAARILLEAERAQAVAQQGIEFRQKELQRLEGAMRNIYIEDTVLGLEKDISALDVLRHQYVGHPSAMARQQGQLQQLEQQALQQLEALGLLQAGDLKALNDGYDREQALRAGLPALPLRKHMEQLLSDRASLAQALENASTVLRDRKADVDTIQARLAGQPVIQASTALREALERAKALGDTDAAIKKAIRHTRECQAALDQAMAGLGQWTRSAGELAAMVMPSPQVLAAWLAERRDLQAKESSAADRLRELTAAAEKCELRLSQYREQHNPATQEELIRARRLRDDTWQSIKQGAASLAEAAEPFEAALRETDDLADRRYGKAHEVAQLQSLQHQWEQARQDEQQAQLRHTQNCRMLDDFDEKWRVASSGLGLSGLSLEQAPDWQLTRTRVLEAGQALDRALHDQRLLQETQQAAQAELTQALNQSDQTPAVEPSCTLDGLRTAAEARIREADTVAARHEAWQAQVIQAGFALDVAQQTLDETQSRDEQWKQSWTDALSKAGLPADTSPGAAQGVLSVITEVAGQLDQMRRVRSEGLEVMQAALQDFAREAGRLARAAGLEQAQTESVSHTQAFEISQALSHRLAQASRAQEESAKLDRAIQAERAEIRAAQEALLQSQAAVAPMLERAGVGTLEALGPVIEKADTHRRLQQRVEQARARLLQEGDGLTPAQLQAEIDDVDVTDVVGQWTLLQADIEQATAARSDLAVQLAEAKRVLHAMTGADDAARAEADRQDALARMSDAAERYVKVYTATRLLRWSIDRYREEKQGPMLARASAIFAQLTLNSFERLRVDFDRDPMVLEGQRSDGRCVGIEGLSDGTRDQLYLALRLAALELHLEQAPALPFIADDLFINYDDDRTKAGLRAMAELSRHTQVIFLSHHEALLEPARQVFGDGLNVIRL